jgi:hypothetical protein
MEIKTKFKIGEEVYYIVPSSHGIEYDDFVIQQIDIRIYNDLDILILYKGSGREINELKLFNSKEELKEYAKAQVERW